MNSIVKTILNKGFPVSETEKQEQAAAAAANQLPCVLCNADNQNCLCNTKPRARKDPPRKDESQGISSPIRKKQLRSATKAAKDTAEAKTSPTTVVDKTADQPGATAHAQIQIPNRAAALRALPTHTATAVLSWRAKQESTAGFPIITKILNEDLSNQALWMLASEMHEKTEALHYVFMKRFVPDVQLAHHVAPINQVQLVRRKQVDLATYTPDLDVEGRFFGGLLGLELTDGKGVLLDSHDLTSRTHIKTPSATAVRNCKPGEWVQGYHRAQDIRLMFPVPASFALSLLTLPFGKRHPRQWLELVSELDQELPAGPVKAYAHALLAWIRCACMGSHQSSALSIDPTPHLSTENEAFDWWLEEHHDQFLGAPRDPDDQDHREDQGEDQDEDHDGRRDRERTGVHREAGPHGDGGDSALLAALTGKDGGGSALSAAPLGSDLQRFWAALPRGAQRPTCDSTRKAGDPCGPEAGGGSAWSAAENHPGPEPPRPQTRTPQTVREQWLGVSDPDLLAHALAQHAAPPPPPNQAHAPAAALGPSSVNTLLSLLQQATAQNMAWQQVSRASLGNTPPATTTASGGTRLAEAIEAKLCAVGGIQWTNRTALPKVWHEVQALPKAMRAEHMETFIRTMLRNDSESGHLLIVRRFRNRTLARDLTQHDFRLHLPEGKPHLGFSLLAFSPLPDAEQFKENDDLNALAHATTRSPADLRNARTKVRPLPSTVEELANLCMATAVLAKHLFTPNCPLYVQLKTLASTLIRYYPAQQDIRRQVAAITGRTLMAMEQFFEEAPLDEAYRMGAFAQLHIDDISRAIRSGMQLDSAVLPPMFVVEPPGTGFAPPPRVTFSAPPPPSGRSSPYPFPSDRAPATPPPNPRFTDDSEGCRHNPAWHPDLKSALTPFKNKRVALSKLVKRSGISGGVNALHNVAPDVPRSMCIRYQVYGRCADRFCKKNHPTDFTPKQSTADALLNALREGIQKLA